MKTQCHPWNGGTDYLNDFSKNFLCQKKKMRQFIASVNAAAQMPFISPFVWTHGTLRQRNGFSQNYWVFRFCPSSGILKFREHHVSETRSFSVFRWGGRHPLCSVPYKVLTWITGQPLSVVRFSAVVQWLRLAVSKAPSRVDVFANFTKHWAV
jgi:hypothetical protein